jgi:hypothetical protein
MDLERTKIWSWVPTGPKSNNDCAGKDQQQITANFQSQQGLKARMTVLAKTSSKYCQFWVLAVMIYSSFQDAVK